MRSTIIALAIVSVSSTASAQTSINWADVRGGNLSLTTAFITKDGWEVWAFGVNRSETQDLELGRLFPLGERWLLGGYGVVWPESGKTFGLPFALYHDTVLGGDLRLKLGYYLPLNGGPTIIFSDESSLLWRAKDVSWGMVLSCSKVNSIEATARLGMKLNLSVGDTTFGLSYQPVYISGNGAPHFRLGVTQRF